MKRRRGRERRGTRETLKLLDERKRGRDATSGERLEFAMELKPNRMLRRMMKRKRGNIDR